MKAFIHSKRDCWEPCIQALGRGRPQNCQNCPLQIVLSSVTDL